MASLNHSTSARVRKRETHRERWGRKMGQLFRPPENYSFGGYKKSGNNLLPLFILFITHLDARVSPFFTPARYLFVFVLARYVSSYFIRGAFVSSGSASLRTPIFVSLSMILR